MSGTYFRILLKEIFRSQEDVLTEFCFSMQAQGLAENLKFVQPDLTFDPTIVNSDSFAVDVFFIEPPSENFYAQLAARFPNVVAERFEEPNKDWLIEWKKGYVSFPLVQDFWVVPSWLQAPAHVQKIIRIDPGMAFGTGTHTTTQLAALLLYDNILTKEKTKLPVQSCLDVGTGTGILAMLAELMGVAKIVGTEIDPIARDVARENIELNHLKNIQIPDQQVESIEQKFDAVVANIIDGALVLIRKHLVNCLKPNGALIVSGILLDHETEFLEKFLQNSLEVIRRESRDEWVSFLMRKKE